MPSGGDDLSRIGEKLRGTGPRESSRVLSGCLAKRQPNEVNEVQ